MKLSKKTVDVINSSLVSIVKSRGAHSEFITYMENMDRLYMREDMYAHESHESKKKLNRLVAPIILPQVAAACSYLSNLFLAQDPIFPVVAPNKFTEVANQVNALYRRDSIEQGWRVELQKTLQDGLKYNLQCAEVMFSERVSYSADSRAPSGSVSVNKSGNRIEHRSLYNTFWDPSVPPSKIHSEGVFAGYTKRMSYIALLELFKTAKADSLQIKAKDLRNLKGPVSFSFYTPLLKSKLWQDGDGRADWVTENGHSIDWDKFLMVRDSSGKLLSNQSPYEGYTFFKLYMRIIPDDVEMDIPGGDVPQIWEFWFVNGTLAFAEQKTNTHNYIPMIFGQPLCDGLDYQTLSFGENLIDFQEFASKLWTAELRSTDRILGDRGLYNPLMINPKHMESGSMTAKIPLRGAAIGADPRLAYFQIPYNDPALGLRIQQAGQIFEMANLTSGQNQTSQGQFVKGNKTDGQFRESVASSEARYIQMGIVLEDQFFNPIKDILIKNTIQFQTAQVLFDPVTEEDIDIKPEQLQTAVLSFEVSDGLAAAQTRAALPVFQAAFQVLLQTPGSELEQGYDVPGMFAYIMNLAGARRIKDFKWTPEQLQERQQAAIQQAESMARAENTGAQTAQPNPAPSQE